MKLNVGTREDDTPYMLSAEEIGMNISEMFGRSEEWVALCDKSPALARAFGEVHFALDEEDPQYLSCFIHEIDKNADALEVIQDDDDLSYPYLTAKRLLALCETDDSKPAKPPVASVSYSWDDIQSWLDERGNAPDVPFAGHVWTPEQQADVMATLQEYLEMHVYESFGRTLYVEALDAEWEKIK